MSNIVFSLFLIAAAVACSFTFWRLRDRQADASLWRRLAAHQPYNPSVFNPAMVVDLPDPARLFFNFAIRPGTPLYTVTEISMKGDFSLGSKAKPNYMPMCAEQIIAAPHGFVWKLTAGKKPMKIYGSDAAEDGASWSRFWLLGLIPVARAGGNRDHARAAFGRYVAEAVFWSPAALLPDANTKWQAIAPSTARVTVRHRGLEQAVDLTVDDQGRPIKVKFQHWSDANLNKKYQLQPFGGYLSEFKEFDGFQLPTRIEAGNFFETENYFPFFRVHVLAIRFPKNSDR